METTKVYYCSDGMYSREIERKSVKCPFCGVINIPEYLFLKGIKEQIDTITNRYNKWLYLFHISSC